MSKMFKVIQYLPVSTERKLAMKRALTIKLCMADIETARKLKDRDKIRIAKDDLRYEVEMIDAEIDDNVTSRLLNDARKLHVAKPNVFLDDHKTLTDFWYESHITGGRYLTPQGVSAIRAEIRNELKWRRDSRVHYMTFITTITGLIGSSIGLISLFLNKFL